MTTPVPIERSRFVSDAPPEVVAALGGREPTVEQWAAISHPLEPCALIAGAGSGKTAVMAARIAWLVATGKARAGEILGLTFTNKAAENLTERVRRAVAPLGLRDGDEPTILTYHAFAQRLIADYGLRAGIEPDTSLLSEAQTWQLCAELLMGRTYDVLEVRTPYYVSFVRRLAEDCSNHLRDPSEIVAHDRDFLAKVERSAVNISGKAIDAARKRIEVAAVVADYAKVKEARGCVDYGDQIRLGYRLALDPRVAADFRSRWRVVLLDEYQDTNVAQARMLKALMPEGYPVMAVGDPDQNIYAWRGASLQNLLAFAEQFPGAGGAPAAVKQLRRNFRSGRRILELANRLIERIPPQRRPPGKVLVSHPPLGEGEVAVLLAPDQVAEAERIADECLRAHEAGTPWREMAVLCRKKRLFDGIVEVFRGREIPLEVIGLGGLLKVPEVLDLVAMLRVLDDPLRNVALARLLLGPRWRVGYRDLAVVARHAAGKNRDLKTTLPGDEETAGELSISLAEALADLDAIDGLSEEARRRLRRFNDELSRLRRLTYLPLPELVARALDTLGLVRELDASPSPAAPAARRNLANFLDRVAAFSPLDGEPTLGALVEWLDAVGEADEEIEAAHPSDVDAVKAMTIHQAKGLEFDVVFVPGLAAGNASAIFPDTRRQANPVRGPQHMPFELRGDNAVLPRFDGNLAQFERELDERALEEERRLLYVACTRARRRLVCSAAHWYQASGMREDLKTPLGPSEFWKEIRSFPEVEVLGEEDVPPENPLVQRREQRATEWPRRAGREPDPLFPDGLAAAVQAARERAQAEARSATPLGDEEPPLPGTEPIEKAPRRPGPPLALSVSELVVHARCAKKFYWTTVSPLPVRPSPAARVGTAVHAWIQERSTRPPTLIDLDEYDTVAPGLDGERVRELKEVFRASRFEGVAPVLVEAPFVIVAGDFVIRGRIDAVYERGEGHWEVVDFKSGAPPAEAGPEWLQLDLYALAVQEIWGKRAGDVTVTFAYLGAASEDDAGTRRGVVAERSAAARPAVELRAGLEERLAAIAAGRFDATPGPWCRHCDFVRFCEPGRAFLDARLDS